MKNVLITGASRGIGAECARLFAENGYRVFINYNKSRAEAEAAAARTGGIAVRADVSKADEVAAMAEKVSEYGGADVLINNAGIAGQLLFSDITEEEWDRMFDVNIKGMFLVTKAILPHMIHEKRGKIINVSSVWGVTGGSCEVHYSASKAAVIGFTKALAKEVGLSGIQVNCIAPGVIDTQMNSMLCAEDMAALKEEIPLARIGRAEEAARLALFLASDGADYITGEVININGGMNI